MASGGGRRLNESPRHTATKKVEREMPTDAKLRLQADRFAPRRANFVDRDVAI